MSNTFKKITEFAQRFELRFNLLDDDYIAKSLGFLDEEVRETKDAFISDDNIEFLDGCLDVSFVALNLVYKKLRLMGYIHEEATQLTELLLIEVADNNLSKAQPDGTVLYQDGKVKKPDGWAPPKISTILEAYGFIN